MAEVKITKDNSKAEVLECNIPVLVDFWASWCGPCKMLAPILEEIANEYEGKVKVGKVNVDEEPELSNAFKISSIPCLILFKEGNAVNAMIGYRPKEDILEMIK